MAKEIVKQPNGKYAVWSTIVDNFTDYDCSKDELVEVLLEEEMKLRKINLEYFVKRQIENPTRNMEAALEQIEIQHGKEERTDVERLFET